MNERKIPDQCIPGNRSRTFTFEDTPEHFRTHHSSAKWAQVIVEEGSIEFREPANELHEDDLSMTLEAGESFVIVPNVDHNAQPNEGAIFYVQFYVDPQSPEPLLFTPIAKR